MDGLESQVDPKLLDQVRQLPEADPLVPELFWWAAAAPDRGTFLSRALPLVRDALRAEAVMLLGCSDGEWNRWGETSRRYEPPTALLAEALDRTQAVWQPPWSIVPLGQTESSGLLAVHRSVPLADLDRQTLLGLAAVLGQALACVQRRQRDTRRIHRLETILGIAASWNQEQELVPLLHRMAEAATRLLGADRASIFLWDKPNKSLVGRPALGVPGNELRVPDHSGVVGQVVRSGVPMRVSRQLGQERINRAVDEQLGYQTRTLLCVPLRDAQGECFGAFEVINKLEGNFTADDEAALVELAEHAAVVLRNTEQRQRLLETNRRISEQAATSVQLVGECPAIRALRATIQRVADTDLAVLILGENGTGKEVVAQLIHYGSPRRDQPFIAVNCAAITETLLESELFGHEKGAFTGAESARAGKFELASGGTLFLDEIGDMSPSGQSKLLRVLEEKVVVRVGGSRQIHTDARVIAATNQDLASMVRDKKFREDLYFRLNVVTLELPPLRQRGEDVLLLAEHFLADFCRRRRRPPSRLTESARRRLMEHPWPGNVRELRNIMERLAYLGEGDAITADDLPFIRPPRQTEAPQWSGELPLSEATWKFQTEYIRQAIARAGGNMSEAAKQLGLHRSNLYRKMRQLGMHEATDAAGGE
jgi:transcriptional regulator with GAF, ATPase, and Fis domain